MLYRDIREAASAAARALSAGCDPHGEVARVMREYDVPEREARCVVYAALEVLHPGQS